MEDTNDRPFNTSYEELFNSAYVLVPAGHGRWSYRLSETIKACSIPVIITDGFVPPYEDLIDWNNFAVMLPENITGIHIPGERRLSIMMTPPKTILDFLTRDPEVIKAKRKMACRIKDTYFGTRGKEFESLLIAAAVRVGIREHNRIGLK